MSQAPRFWRSIDQRYNLEGVTCTNCGTNTFPARTMCPKCRHLSLGKLKPFPFSGRGTVESFTVVHTPPQGYELQAPYAMAVIRLAEGPRLTAQVVDMDPEQVKVGLAVEKVFRRINQDGESGVIHYGYKFRPARDTAKGQRGTAPLPHLDTKGTSRPGASGRLG